MPDCKACLAYFTPSLPSQKCCSPECGRAYVEAKTAGHPERACLLLPSILADKARRDKAKREREQKEAAREQARYEAEEARRSRPLGRVLTGSVTCPHCATKISDLYAKVCPKCRKALGVLMERSVL